MSYHGLTSRVAGQVLLGKSDIRKGSDRSESSTTKRRVFLGTTPQASFPITNSYPKHQPLSLIPKRAFIPQFQPLLVPTVPAHRSASSSRAPPTPSPPSAPTPLSAPSLSSSATSPSPPTPPPPTTTSASPSTPPGAARSRPPPARPRTPSGTSSPSSSSRTPPRPSPRATCTTSS
jgi:hypothetical protein